MLRAVCALFVFTLIASAAFAQMNKGNIVFTPKNTDPVVFSHDYHTRVRGVKCHACHFTTFSRHGDSFEMKKEKMTKRDFCEHCHNGLKGFDANSENNCAKCHKKS